MDSLPWPRLASAAASMNGSHGPSKEGELATLQRISDEYEKARLVRVCRVQRYALEIGGGLPKETERLRKVAGVVDQAHVRERMLELNTWLGK